MYIARAFKKHSWWELVDLIDQIDMQDVSEAYLFEVVDELRLRLLESVSEGGSFKIKAKAEDLKQKILASSHKENKELINLFYDLL